MPPRPLDEVLPPPTTIESVQQVATLLEAGEAHRALSLARDLFARGDVPPWLVADLCLLAGGAALLLDAEPVAEQMWRQAIAVDETMAAAHAQLGRLLARQQRDGDAEACCRRALAIEPGRIDTLLTLGGLLARRPAGALAELQRGDAQRADFPAADLPSAASQLAAPQPARPQHTDLPPADFQPDLAARAEAEACYREALRLCPDSVAALTDLGVLLSALQRLDEAEACYRHALALDPQDAHANTNLGLLFETLGRRAEAEPWHRHALQAAPANAVIHGNLGNLLAALGRRDEAEACLRRAIDLDPSSASAHCNLGALLRDSGRPHDAEASLRRALALQPGHLLAQLNLAVLLLAQGRYVEGWPLHESRHHPGLAGNGIPPPPVAMPRWRGEPLDGLSVLVWPEQGLGDQIQFARYAPMLKQRGAARVTLVCQKPLKALFDTLAGVDAVFAAEIANNRFELPGVDLAGHDRWVFPLSLPLRFGTGLHDVPAATPYLHASPERCGRWAARIAEGLGSPTAALRVGIVWRGNPRHDNDADRSLPGLATLAPLWSVPGVRFISLQTGAAGDAALEPPPGQPLLHLGAELADFADTAAALAALDLLICVDTSIAHLAGAIGTPCWLMLPAHRCDWRWLERRDDSPWYPGTMRLFRQTRRGDWPAVVDALRQALDQLCVMRSSAADNCLAWIGLDK